MQIPDISAQLKLELGVGAKRDLALASLRPGQVLQAVAISLNSNGRVKLRIGNNDVMAQTRLQTAVGQKLSLTVVKAGALPELHLIRTSSTADLQALALKSALPRQIPLDQMLDNLTRVGNQPFVAESPELRETIRRLFAGLRSPVGLKSGRHLSRAFGATGLFMESHLMHGGVPSDDLKANLLRLLARLYAILKSPLGKAPTGQPTSTGSAQSGVRPEAQQISPERLQTLLKAPAGQPASAGSAHTGVRPDAQQASPEYLQRSLLRELAGQTEGALARLQLNQLASLPTAEREPHVWQLDLPLRDDDQIDVFRLRIAKDESSDKYADTPGWTLTLRFNLRPLGTIEARLALSGSAISTHFWAEQRDTRARIEQYLPQLEQAFARSGLSAARFTVHRGMPPEPTPVKSAFPILDVKA